MRPDDSASIDAQMASALKYLGILFILLCFSATAQARWRTPENNNLVYLETDAGRIIIELNPRFAPKTTAQFRKLVRDGFYDGLRFYRVIDGFVAQGGDGSDLSRELSQPTLPAEFEIQVNPDEPPDFPFQVVQRNDLFAPVTGFIDGFPAAHDEQQQHYWLLHCPGAVAMARDNEVDSGSSDFYIVIGQAPRYLDRNLTIFGRVIHGMPNVQRIQRGPSESNGIIHQPDQQTRIRKAHIAADLPPAQQLSIQVADTHNNAFKRLLSDRRHRRPPFFHQKPPAVLDICQIPLSVKVSQPTADPQ